MPLIDASGQVFRNIFAPITLTVKRQNAAVPLRSPRRPRTIRESSKANFSRPGRDDYEFMRPKSPSWRTGTYHFSSLPNTEVSQLVHAGLTFWGPQTESVKIEWNSPEKIDGVDTSLRDDTMIEDDVLPVTGSQAMSVLDDDDGRRSEGEDDIEEDGIETNEQDKDRGCVLI